MNCLLDTHSFLWAAFNPKKLSKAAVNVVGDAENDVFVSVVTYWEISLKYALGKLELKGAVPDDLPAVARRMGFDVLELGTEEAASFHTLPRVGHKDPFDRMLVHQSIRHHMTLVSCDAELDAYRSGGLKRLW